MKDCNANRETEDVSRDSFSLEAETIHFCQRALLWHYLGAESYCFSPSILQGMLPALAAFVGRRCLCLIRCLCIKWICWTFWKQIFCSNKTDCGCHFKALHRSCKWFRNSASVSVIPTCTLLCMPCAHVCRIKNADGCRWWPWGPSQPWIALTSISWDLTHTLQPGALIQLYPGPLAFLRWTIRMAASSLAPELLQGFLGLPSGMSCVMPDAHLGDWWPPYFIHSEFPCLAYYDKPCLYKHFLILAWFFLF